MDFYIASMLTKTPPSFAIADILNSQGCDGTEDHMLHAVIARLMICHSLSTGRNELM